MSGMQLIVTTAGCAALMKANQSGHPIRVTSVGLTNKPFVAKEDLTDLPGEYKRITDISGIVVDEDNIHVTVSDDSNDEYTLHGIGYWLADDVLFGVYSQDEPILEKVAGSAMLLALDTRLFSATTTTLTFGNTNFINPPARENSAGVVKLASYAEVVAGEDKLKVVTPAGLAEVLKKVAVAAEIDDSGAWKISIAGNAATSTTADGLNPANNYTLKDQISFSSGTGNGKICSAIAGSGMVYQPAIKTDDAHAWEDAEGVRLMALSSSGNLVAKTFTGDLTGLASSARRAKIACELNPDNNYTVRNQISFRDGTGNGKIRSAVAGNGMVYQPSIKAEYAHIWVDAEGIPLMSLDCKGNLQANAFNLNGVDVVRADGSGAKGNWDISVRNASCVLLHNDDQSTKSHEKVVTFHDSELQDNADWLWGGQYTSPGQVYRIYPAHLNVNSAKKAEGLIGAALQRYALGSYELVRRVVVGTSFDKPVILDGLSGSWEYRGRNDESVLYQRIA